MIRGEGGVPVELHNVLDLGAALAPGQQQVLDLVVAGSSPLPAPDELGALSATSFEGALSRVEAYWDRPLSAALKLSTPEPLLNDVYKHLVLSCLAGVRKEPDRPWVRPVHATFEPGIWAWEFAHVSIPLASLGLARPMEPCLRFFVETQPGVGKYPTTVGPDGEVKSLRGCYSGGYARWMNETGSVLWALAVHYRYTRDNAWLQSNRASILAAWDWIQKERTATRVLGPDGRRVAHFGLLPRGRVHDWAGHRYHYAWTDGYTYKGMAQMAAAFREAGLPEADRLTRDVEEYRGCILDCLARVETVDPETGLLFVPNTVYFKQGERGGAWMADGPRALFDTGLLEASSDRRWEPTLALLSRRFGTLAGLTGHFQGALGDEQLAVDADSPYWYCNQTELGWQRDFLARGELEKALLVFYTNLVYGMSPDCHQTVERVNIAESNYAPFQPNSSGNGRVLAMLRQMVIDEQDEARGILWLLRGCPRRWFASGRSIEVDDAPTLFGPMARLRTQATERSITIEFDVPSTRPLRQVGLAVRHPGRLRPRSVTVNGPPAAIRDELILLDAPTGNVRVVCSY